jgi:G3E family GTPase
VALAVPSQRRPAIPITVIGGYLGAGKTTLLNRLLQDPGGRRLGVIVNDFGAIGIDAELLAAASDTGVINLPNGCVCCTLGGDLFETLAALRDADEPPDQIVIEASGVADPAVAAGWGTSAGFEPGGVLVLAAADSIRRQLVDKYVGGEVNRQLAGADLIVLTKTDLCSEVAVSAARNRLELLAPATPVVDAEAPVDVVLGVRPDRVRSGERTAHDGQYVRWAWHGGVLVEDDVRTLLVAFPSILRLKGWIDSGARQLLIQVVGRSVTVAPAGVSMNADMPGSRLEAIALADQLDVDALTARFDELAR